MLRFGFLLHSLLVAAAFLGSRPAVAQMSRLEDAKALALEGKIDKAYAKLADSVDAKFPPASLHLKYLALGNWAMELKTYPTARVHLEKAFELSRASAATIYYLIGHSYKLEGQNARAKDYFDKALAGESSQNNAFLTRYELSEIAMAEGQPGRAADYLRQLEKRWRRTPKYPEIVWKLIGAEMARNNRHVACRWARKMYVKYPSHPLASDWGVELQQNTYDGKKLGCAATEKDSRERLRNMQLAGLHEKAKGEIDVLKAHRSGDPYETDLLLVSYLDNLSFPDEALDILVRYIETKKSHVPYLNLLGRVAARAGEYSTAIWAYDQVFNRAPQSRDGRAAMFQSAFLSYLIQDYDGAHAKFDRVIRAYGGSAQGRDAKWYVNWIRYLKGNYAVAEAGFKKLYDERIYGRRRRVSYPFRDDRTRYWLAMSVLKQDRFAEARELFERVGNSKDRGYYPLLARQRVSELPISPERRLAVSTKEQASMTEPIEKTDSGLFPMLLFSPSGEKDQPTAMGSADPADNVSVEGAAESEPGSAEIETGTTDDAVAQGEGDEVPAPPAAGPKLEAAATDTDAASEEPEEVAQVTSFRDPRLQIRFDRARELIAIGRYDWARWELFEIESRTSNPTYLKTLMEAYKEIGAYDRAAYISEIYFSGERARASMDSARELWEFNYPRAYLPSVKDASSRFSVPEQLVLSIMRAESHFNKDAVSPVGARGLMQVMPFTANQVRRAGGEPSIAPDELFDPKMNVAIGTRYLARLQKEFGGQVPLVAAGYNAGPHRVLFWLHHFGGLTMDEFIEHVPFFETRNYMKKVVRNFAVYNELYGESNNLLANLTKPIPVRVENRPSPRENWEKLE